MQHADGSGEVFNFTQGTTVSPRDWYVVTLTIGWDDMNEIKSRAVLATSVDSTYLAVRSFTVEDMADYSNTLVPVSGIQPSEHIPDKTSPVIERFDLDLDERTITLYFDEIVNTSTADLSGITLQDMRDTINPTAPMFGDSVTYSGNGPVVQFQLSFEDFRAIKRVGGVGESIFNTYLITSEKTIGDMIHPINMVRAIVDNRAIQVPLQTS